MLPWQKNLPLPLPVNHNPANQPRPQLPDNGKKKIAENGQGGKMMEEKEEEEEEEEEDEELESDTPPAQFLKDARSVLPDVERKDIYAAWDKSRKFKSKGSTAQAYDPNSERVQAALGFLFEPPIEDSPPRQLSRSPPPPPPPPRKKAETLFLPSSPEPEIINHPRPGTSNHNNRKRDAAEVMILNSDDEDDEDDDDHPQPQPRQQDRKGKGRAFSPDHDLDRAPKRPKVVTLSSDSEDNFPVYQSKDKGKGKAVSFAPVHHPPSPPQPDEPISEETSLALILSIVPEVLPSHVLMLLRSEDHRGNADSVVELLLKSKDWPKIGKAVASPPSGPGGEKRKREDEDGVGERKDWLDITKREPVGVRYKKEAIDQLYTDFDLVPVAAIKNVFKTNKFFYAPSYLSLKKGGDWVDLGKKRIAKKAEEDEENGPFEGKDQELKDEMKWLLDRLLKEKAERKRQKREKKMDEQAAKEGTMIECGCCFTDFRFENMVQCADAHLFCKECAVANANAQIGLRQFVLPCMAEDCEAEFTPATASTFLPETSLALLQKIKQEKEVDLAGLEGLEKCPFCPYAYVIDNPYEKLFRCERKGCEKVTCRSCKKDEHLPLTCEESEKEKEKDQKIAHRHKVEEAMSAALIRKCPKCKEPYVKSDGCNFITCSNCHAHSCYICGKLNIAHSGPHWTPAGQCPLFDDTEMRTFEEVEAARKAAASEVPEIDDDDVDPLKVDKPVRGAPILPPGGGAGPANHFGGGAGAQFWGMGGLGGMGFMPNFGAGNPALANLLGVGGFGGFGGGGGWGWGGGAGPVNPPIFQPPQPHQPIHHQPAAPRARARRVRVPPAQVAGPAPRVAAPPVNAPDARAARAAAAERRARGG